MGAHEHPRTLPPSYAPRFRAHTKHEKVDDFTPIYANFLNVYQSFEVQVPSYRLARRKMNQVFLSVRLKSILRVPFNFAHICKAKFQATFLDRRQQLLRIAKNKAFY